MATITIFKNADDLITITYPVAVNLNGDTIFLTVKRTTGGSETDSDAIFKTQVTVGTSTNIAQIVLSDTLTDVTPGNYIADLKRVTAGGDIKPTNTFNFIIRQTVTQRSA